MQVSGLRENVIAPAASAPMRSPVKDQVEFITDGRGRKLQLRGPLSLLEEQRLLVAMGAHADNARALQRALLAARVAAIDDDGVAFPVSFRMYEAMLDEVGMAGLVAVVAQLAPAPVGEPVAIFDGELTEYRLGPYEGGGIGLWRTEDAAPDPELDTAKK